MELTVNGSKANTGSNDLIFSIHLYIILESQIIIIHFYTQNSVWYGSKLKRFLQISDCFQGCRSTARLSVGLDAQERTGLYITKIKMTQDFEDNLKIDTMHNFFACQITKIFMTFLHSRN